MPLQVRKLTPKNLGWGTGKCPEAHVKGFDTYVLLSFLAEETRLHDCGPLDEINECFFVFLGVMGLLFPNDFCLFR